MSVDLFDIPEHRRMASIYAKRWFRRMPTGMVWLEELESAALEGLWRASRRYEAKRELKFTTYAGHCIRSSIADWLRTLNRAAGRTKKSRREAAQCSLERYASVRGIRRSDVAVDSRSTQPSELYDQLRPARLGLCWVDRVLLRLSYDEGWTNREISAAFGRSPHWASVRLMAVRKQMREVIGRW